MKSNISKLILYPKTQIDKHNNPYYINKIIQHTFTFEISTPVTPFTRSGMHCTMLSTSPVSLAAPTSPPPQDTMVTLRAWDNGAATSAAT